MRLRFIAVATVTMVVAAACTNSGTDQSDAGVALDILDETEVVLYSPESSSALALGLPDQVGALRLLPSAEEKTAAEEREYFTDPRVRQILVEGGLAPSRVTIAQKSAVITGPPTAEEQIPSVAVTAAQVKDVPASEFIDWDPTFYLLVTSVDSGDYLWLGEKPADVTATIADRAVRLADFNRFKVAWYPYGDVLYVVVAASDELLEATIKRLPWTADAT